MAKPAGVSVPGGLSLGDLLTTVHGWLRAGKEYYGGQNPGNNPPGKEGAGICPLGNPGNNNPGKPGGNK